MYKEKIKDILDNAQRYHLQFYTNDIFTGPRLYFHRRAVEIQSISITKLEYIYATLASWNMNDRGAKMVCFNQFCESINKIKTLLEKAKKFNIYNINADEWRCLKKIFKNIQVMKTGCKLVGNTKALHHILPELVPPIDNGYTLKYLGHHKKDEWERFRYMLENFFMPIAKNDKFRNKANKWMQQKDLKYFWDTSYMKIIDNLIIGEKKYKE